MKRLIEVEVDIDTDLLQQAMTIAKVKTPSEALNYALEELLRRHEESERRAAAAAAGAGEKR